MNKADIDRFWSKVDIKGPNDCWLWKASTVRGYGKIRIGLKILRSNRVAWEIANGKELGKLQALHTCDNPLCCNPRHLFVGLPIDNARDRNNKGRTVFVSKINANIAEQIRELRKTKTMSQKETGKKFGISRSQVSKIECGGSWK